MTKFRSDMWFPILLVADLLSDSVSVPGILWFALVVFGAATSSD